MGALDAEIAASLRRSREEFVTLVTSIGAGEAARRPAAGGWSVIDLLAHMPEVDWFYLQQALAARNVSDHRFVYFDDIRWEGERVARAVQPSFEALIESLAASHRAVLAVVDELTDDELARSTAHPRGIPYTVGDIFRRLAAHDEIHVAQIREILGALSP